jgi:hypothetical protein
MKEAVGRPQDKIDVEYLRKKILLAQEEMQSLAERLSGGRDESAGSP